MQQLHFSLAKLYVSAIVDSQTKIAQIHIVIHMGVSRVLTVNAHFDEHGCMRVKVKSNSGGSLSGHREY